MESLDDQMIYGHCKRVSSDRNLFEIKTIAYQ